MADNQQSKCTGNCLNCLPAQRAYCASQHAYSNMQVLDAVMGIVLSIKESVDETKKKVDALQSCDEVFNPESGEKSEIPNLLIAQSGDGAENRSPETNKL